MRFCSSCGAKIEDGGTFCAICVNAPAQPAKTKAPISKIRVVIGKIFIVFTWTNATFLAISILSVIITLLNFEYNPHQSRIRVFLFGSIETSRVEFIPWLVVFFIIVLCFIGGISFRITTGALGKVGKIIAVALMVLGFFIFVAATSSANAILQSNLAAHTFEPPFVGLSLALSGNFIFSVTAIAAMILMPRGWRRSNVKPH